MSLCRTRNLEENEHPENQVNNFVKMKENSNENKHNIKEKKKKICIPKDTIYKEDEEIITKENQKKNEEIINTDIPKAFKYKKTEEKINFNMEEMDSTRFILKEKEDNNIKNKENQDEINNEELLKKKSNQENKENKENNEEIKNINNEKIKEEHIENDEIKELKEDKFLSKKEEKEEEKEEIIKEDNKDDINKNDNKENLQEEKINKVPEEKVEFEEENKQNIIKNEEKEEKEDTNNETLKSASKNLENQPEILKEEIKQELDENKEEIENKKELEEKKEEIIEEPKEEIKDELKEKSIENKEENKDEIEQEKNEEKEEVKNNEKEQIQDENNNEVKEEQENLNEIHEEKNEEVKSPEEKEDENLNNQENKDNQAFNEFLTKNDSLIKVININLESKGYSKADIQSKFDEVFQSITETKLDQNHISLVNNLLSDVLSITVDSDKKDLEKFFTDLFSSLNYDKEKIHEQILTFAEDIEEQEKLKTRKLNRNIRSYIKDCQEQLNQIFKQDDMPSDRVVSYDKFCQIVEEVGMKMKKEYMDVLLYQMKMAVPKNRSIHEFNMIVIVDFLK